MIDLLHRLAKPLPRYTSYPTAPHFKPLKEEHYIEVLKEIAGPISLYLHIPFCKSMCLFCACSVILNRKEENERRYVDYLCKEIDLISSYLEEKKRVVQLHLGGGTPTKLSEPLLEKLFHSLSDRFSIDFTKEIAIEIDPRTVGEDRGKKLRRLRAFGFNRVSLGVQDVDSRVQEAVKRRQSLEVTEYAYYLARELGFTGINFDLIYGLPLQTLSSFSTTIEKITSLRPDRIALFSYAKVPWLKPHQMAIPDHTLPSIEEKFALYAHARQALISSGYLAIGMDHFALPEDSLAKSYFDKSLQRNFQGYTVAYADDQLGFGVTAIGFAKRGYFQNLKELDSYYASLDAGALPLERGRMLSREDLIRRFVIHTLMCNFELDKINFLEKYHITFDHFFQEEQERLSHLEKEGLLTNSTQKITVTPLGELFVRNIANCFDSYFDHQKKENLFSQSV